MKVYVVEVLHPGGFWYVYGTKERAHQAKDLLDELMREGGVARVAIFKRVE